MSENLSVKIAEIGAMEACNAYIDDPKALAQLWDENGYWLFKKVLDPEALDNYRQPILDKLKGLGVVDADSKEPIYSRRGMEKFGARMFAGYENPEGVNKSKTWLEFLRSPKVNAFFSRVLGYDPAWIPIAEVRMVPPDEPTELGNLIFPHQDAFYNAGYRFTAAWMPLFDSPRASGGLAVARGQYRRGLMHDASDLPRCPIPAGTIPDEAWVTTDYEAGDVVFFRSDTPHSGVRNHSMDRFRLSFDARWILPGEKPIVLGVVEASSAQSITVRQDNGVVETYGFTPDSYVRAYGTIAVKLEDVPTVYPVGEEAFLTLEGDKVLLLRYPKY